MGKAYGSDLSRYNEGLRRLHTVPLLSVLLTCNELGVEKYMGNCRQIQEIHFVDFNVSCCIVRFNIAMMIGCL